MLSGMKTFIPYVWPAFFVSRKTAFPHLPFLKQTSLELAGQQQSLSILLLSSKVWSCLKWFCYLPCYFHSVAELQQIKPFFFSFNMKPIYWTVWPPLRSNIWLQVCTAQKFDVSREKMFLKLQKHIRLLKRESLIANIKSSRKISVL